MASSIDTKACVPRFPAAGGTPVQVVDPPGGFGPQRVDRSSMRSEDALHQAQRLVTAEMQTPFDLAGGPVFRATLVTLGPDEHWLLLCVHHIVSDAWSLEVLRRDLLQLYVAERGGAPASLSEVPVQYGDYTLWQQQRLDSEAMELQLQYWRAQLADLSSLDLPTDFPRAAEPTHEGGCVDFVVPDTLLEQLRALNRRQGVTMAMTMQTVFTALLHRHTGQDDIVIGSAVANRNHHELENLIGFFVDSLVMRTDHGGNPTFAELLARTRHTALHAYDHQDVPFERVVDDLQPDRDLSRNPLFQVVFVMENDSIAPVRIDADPTGLEIRPIVPESVTARFDLALHVHESAEELSGRIVYDARLFRRSTAEGLAGCLVSLLESAVAAPNTPVAELRLMSDEEQHRLLVTLNDTTVAMPGERCVHRQFEAQAARTPGQVALVSADRQLTYAELDRRSNQLACRLIDLGVDRGALVGCCMHRGIDLVTAILAILKAGAVYVPLSPDDPEARLAQLLDDVRPRILLTESPLRSRLPRGLDDGAPVLCIDRQDTAIDHSGTEPPRRRVTGSDLAYVIHTSGSTGRPKGVMIEHRALTNFLAWSQRSFPLGRDDAVLQRTQNTFDASIWELLAPLVAGRGSSWPIPRPTAIRSS